MILRCSKQELRFVSVTDLDAPGSSKIDTLKHKFPAYDFKPEETVLGAYRCITFRSRTIDAEYFTHLTVCLLDDVWMTYFILEPIEDDLSIGIPHKQMLCRDVLETNKSALYLQLHRFLLHLIDSITIDLAIFLAQGQSLIDV